jgi:hypothetical protein
MNETSTTTATLDQADEEILTASVSDEALEAAAGTSEKAGTQRGGLPPSLFCC